MSGITTHVLDTSRGRPAQGVPVRLEVQEGAAWKELGRGFTDADGRLKARETVVAGTYRITFDTAAWFKACGGEGVYPEVTIPFVVKDPAAHYHVPLLISPFGYSTYRGS